MKNTVTKTNFRDSFFNAGRKDQFSYDGLGALFDWIEQYEEDCEMEMELDVVALCCDFTEYGHPQECAEEYGISGDDEEIMEWLINNTPVIEFEGGIIIRAF